MSLVQIPQRIRAAIAEMATHRNLSAEAGQFSAAYRSQPGQAVVLSETGKIAYLAARLPATYAAVSRACERLAESGFSDFESLLDAGCGPGTASLVAAELWPSLSAVTRSDLDSAWRPVASALGDASSYSALSGARWLTAALESRDYPVHDAVIAAYALNEVPTAQHSAAIRSLWRAAGRALILVEPGTPQGFLNIHGARTQLLAEGAFIAAPCTHAAECPMSAQDWCHSAVRLQRDALHRAAKGASLPFEDEKFSYLAVTREPAGTIPAGRIVKHPKTQTGHVHLDVCERNGLRRTTVSKRDGLLYKSARKADWGDGWPG